MTIDRSLKKGQGMNFFKNLKIKLNQIKPVYGIFIYLILSFILILFYIKQADYNINLLLHVNYDVLELNPQMKFKNLVVLQKEGYDGQFYYFISRYIYDNKIKNLTLDSTYFRMLRIGSSLLYGIIPSLIGWNYYVYWVLFLHFFIFILSYLLFYRILDDDIKYLSIIYLFNPYTIISNMLLIGDTIFIALFMILIYCYTKLNFNLLNKNKIKMNHFYYISLLLSIYLILIKETSLIYLSTFLFIFILKKDYKGILLNTVPIIIFFIWLFFVYNLFHFSDLNPVSHTQRIRFPFKDLLLFYFKSFNNMHSFRELSKFFPYILILFIYFSLLLQISNFLNLKYFKNISMTKFLLICNNLILYFPIGFIFLIISIVDIEYFLAFDNIFRIFSFSFLWILFIKLDKKNYNDYSFFIFNFMITILLVLRYTLIKKIGNFITL
jgi:hypothetical protein